MNFDFANYPVLVKLSVNPNYDLLLFSSCYSDEKQFPEILGSEIFLFDKKNNPIWQVKSPAGERHVFNELTKEYEVEPYEWYFSGLYQKDGKFLAEKFNGDVFELDMETGKAEYLYWTK